MDLWTIEFFFIDNVQCDVSSASVKATFTRLLEKTVPFLSPFSKKYLYSFSNFLPKRENISIFLQKKKKLELT